MIATCKVQQTQRRAGMPGQNNPNAKLSDNEVELLRTLVEEGMAQCEAALKFDISRGQVSKLVRYLYR